MRTIEAPVRTCVGCGIRAAKPELIRLVAAEGELIPDANAGLPGRGAYLHPSLACLERAQRRKAFSRALRLPAAPSAGRVAEYLASVAGCASGGTDGWPVPEGRRLTL